MEAGPAPAASEGRWAEVKRYIDQALVLDPNQAEALGLQALFLFRDYRALRWAGPAGSWTDGISQREGLGPLPGLRGRW